MELVTKKRLHLFSGRRQPAAGRGDRRRTSASSSASRTSPTFANGEMHCRFGESIRGADVFIIQTHCAADGMSINDSLMEQLIMIDAAKRASAKRITAVCPFYGYARQDRKAEGREPITAKLVADMFTVAGADRIVSVDLHSGQIQGFFDGPVDHLTAMPVLVDYLADARRRPRHRVARRRPGEGGRALRQTPGRRPRHRAQAPGQGRQERGRGPRRHRRGRRPQLRAHRRHDRHRRHHRRRRRHPHGARAPPRSGPRHPRRALRPGHRPAQELGRSPRSSSPTRCRCPPEKQFDKLEVLSVAPIIADAIDAVFEDTSVSEIFGGENQS